MSIPSDPIPWDGMGFPWDPVFIPSDCSTLERINGFGPRKDALDDVCFSLYNCYRCVNMQNGCGTKWFEMKKL